VLVVAVPLADERPPLQGATGMGNVAEDSVGGGAKGDWEVEEPVDSPGLAGRREMRTGSAGHPRLHGGEKAGDAAGNRRRRE